MTVLTGRVLDPSCPGWEAARRNFCTRLDYSRLVPQKVVFCQSPEDVQNAVRFARENGIPLRARSGRHSYEAYSLVENGLIVDVSEMGQISVDGEAQTATVGAGVFCLDLHENLYDVGFTLPAASGGSVGIAGLTLGGGFGVTSRKFGLTCDNLLGIEIVDAQGRLLHADARENDDLYWACRGGGGGNFGIVTSFEFQVHPISNVAIWNITWGWDDFEAVVDAWQHWAPSTVDTVSTFLRLAVNGVITLFGLFAPDNPAELAGFSSLLTPVLTAATPRSVNVQLVPYNAAAATFAGADPLNPQWMIHPHNDRQPFKSTSAISRELFPPEVIKLLKAQIEAAPSQADWETNEPSMVQLLAGGGTPSRIAIDATAVPHRSAKFVAQYDAYWTDPADAERTTTWIEGVRTAMRPHADGAYVNYADGSIPNYLDAYYGPNLSRLIEIKRRYDPENVFRFPQSIPTAVQAS